MTKEDALWAKVEQAIKQNLEEAWSISDFMWKHPELGNQEFQASAKHRDFLERRGFLVERNFCGLPTAYKAVLGSGEPRLILLVEYDALPEIGHACGHNVHGVMSLLAAAGLKEVWKEMEGTLQVIGTPAEETDGAKVAMAEAGVFHGAALAMMIHTGAGRSFVDYRCLAMDALEFSFEGRGAHAAAAPWEGRNALNGVQLFFHALDMLRQHVPPDVRMHGVVVQGGAAANIVPDHGVCRFYFRASQRSYLNELLEKVYNCAKGAALATDTRVTWRNYEISFDNLRCNGPAVDLVEGIYTEEGVALSPPPESCGSSDMGNVSQSCPALQPVLTMTERFVAAHTKEYASLCGITPEAHGAIEKGARILAKTILRVGLHTTLRGRIREAFHAPSGTLLP